MTPVSSGYADVNGIKLDHEIYGQGEPLVLLPGGLMTIGEMSPRSSPSRRLAASATELAPIIDKYLADPLTNPRRRGGRLPGARTGHIQLGSLSPHAHPW